VGPISLPPGISKSILSSLMISAEVSTKSLLIEYLPAEIAIAICVFPFVTNCHSHPWRGFAFASFFLPCGSSLFQVKRTRLMEILSATGFICFIKSSSSDNLITAEVVIPGRLSLITRLFCHSLKVLVGIASIMTLRFDIKVCLTQPDFLPCLCDNCYPLQKLLSERRLNLISITFVISHLRYCCFPV
jgi:hypothetical protein